MILSNGDRSQQRDKYTTYYDHMMPEGSHTMIRTVTINHSIHSITGFSFFDKEGALLWEIGDNYPVLKVKTVLLEENEVIIGVVAKLYPDYQSCYTDW